MFSPNDDFYCVASNLEWLNAIILRIANLCLISFTKVFLYVLFASSTNFKIVAKCIKKMQTKIGNNLHFHSHLDFVLFDWFQWFYSIIITVTIYYSIFGIFQELESLFDDRNIAENQIKTKNNNLYSECNIIWITILST